MGCRQRGMFADDIDSVHWRVKLIISAIDNLGTTELRCVPVVKQASYVWARVLIIKLNDY